MTKDYIGYEDLTDSALRSVVRGALKHAQQHGLLGGHHFYLTFKTGDPGVVMPDFLRARYPEEITIVLQNQFWDLKAEDGHFEVTLTFQKLPATLVVPYKALTAFVDPGVQFGLQFRNAAARTAQSESGAPAPGKKSPSGDAAEEPQPAPAEGQTDESSPPLDETPQVVQLDKFRKK